MEEVEGLQEMLVGLSFYVVWMRLRGDCFGLCMKGIRRLGNGWSILVGMGGRETVVRSGEVR